MDAWNAVGVTEPIPPTGVLVWEGVLGGTNYSGTFIADYLINRGYEVNHTSVFPSTMMRFIYLLGISVLSDRIPFLTLPWHLWCRTI